MPWGSLSMVHLCPFKWIRIYFRPEKNIPIKNNKGRVTLILSLINSPMLIIGQKG